MIVEIINLCLCIALFFLMIRLFKKNEYKVGKIIILLVSIVFIFNLVIHLLNTFLNTQIPTSDPLFQNSAIYILIRSFFQIGFCVIFIIWINRHKQ
jgi:hypothetical protein